MTNELQGGGNRELSEDINVLTAEIRMDLQGISDAIFRVGERLAHIRKNEMEKQKGGWNKYCVEEIGISRKQASRFIRVYKRFGGETPGSRLNKPLRILDELVDFTDEQLKQDHELLNGETKKPTDISRREIEELKKSLKAEGKKRMSLGGKGGVEEGSANLQQLGKVNEIIAKKSGMSARNVAYLIAVYRNRLDLFERVFDGTMSINKAYTQMKAEVGIRVPDWPRHKVRLIRPTDNI